MSRQYRNSVTLLGPPLWGIDVRIDAEDGICPGRLPGQGSKAADRKAAPPGEGWKMVLPIPGRGLEGGGCLEGQDVNPPEAEHGRAIYWDETDYGPL